MPWGKKIFNLGHFQSYLDYGCHSAIQGFAHHDPYRLNKTYHVCYVTCMVGAVEVEAIVLEAVVPIYLYHPVCPLHYLQKNSQAYVQGCVYNLLDLHQHAHKECQLVQYSRTVDTLLRNSFLLPHLVETLGVTLARIRSLLQCLALILHRVYCNIVVLPQLEKGDNQMVEGESTLDWSWPEPHNLVVELVVKEDTVNMEYRIEFLAASLETDWSPDVEHPVHRSFEGENGHEGHVDQSLVNDHCLVETQMYCFGSDQNLAFAFAACQIWVGL